MDSFKVNKQMTLWIGIISCIFVFVLFYSLPKAIELEIRAMEFSMEDASVNKDGATPVVVKLVGYKRNVILSASSYWGQLIIGDKVYEVDRILLNRHSNIVAIEKGSGEALSLGTVFLNRDLSKITLNVIDKNIWRVEDGTVIAGPAMNAQEAVGIANGFYQQDVMFKETVIKIGDKLAEDTTAEDQTSGNDLKKYTYVGTFSNGKDIYTEASRYGLQEAAWKMFLVEDGAIIKTFEGTPSKPKFSKDRNQILFIDNLQFEAVGNVALYDVRTDKIEMLTDFQLGLDGKLETVKDVEWYGDEGHMLCIVGSAVGTITQGGEIYDLDPATKVMQKIDLTEVATQWTKLPYEIVDIALSEQSVDLTLVEWTDDNFMYYYYTVHTLNYEELSELKRKP